MAQKLWLQKEGCVYSQISGNCLFLGLKTVNRSLLALEVSANTILGQPSRRHFRFFRHIFEYGPHLVDRR